MVPDAELWTLPVAWAVRWAEPSANTFNSTFELIVTKPLAGFAFHQLFQLFQLKSKRTNKQKYQIQRLQKESTELVANIPGVSPDEPNAYGWIVGLGGKLKSLPLPPDAFAEFAIVKYPAQLLGFVTRFGLLDPIEGRDHVDHAMGQAERMREVLTRKPGEVPMPLMIGLRTRMEEEKKRVFLQVEPVNLLQALWLQLAQAQSEGFELHECKHCHKLFARGGNSGRSLKAEFCSDAHRKKFNSLARSR